MNNKNYEKLWLWKSIFYIFHYFNEFFFDFIHRRKEKEEEIVEIYENEI